MTKTQREAFRWLAERNGDGMFVGFGHVLAAGEVSPSSRAMWNKLRELGVVEFYNPTGKGHGRVRIAACAP